jgi:hypothetical protein
MEFNKVPSIDPHADPLSTLRLLRKHTRRVKQCDTSQAISDKEIIMRMVSLRPECKVEQVGTIEYEIAKHYETFKIEVEKTGYGDYTLASFQKVLKKHHDDHIKKLVKKDGDKKAEAFYSNNGGFQKKFKAKFTGKCNYCKIPGHKAEDCRKKKRNQGNNGNNNNNNGNNGQKKYKSRIMCFNCQKMGHYSSECHAPRRQGQQNANNMDQFSVANMEQCHFVNISEQVEEEQYVPWSFEIYSDSEPSIVDDDDDAIEFEDEAVEVDDVDVAIASNNDEQREAEVDDLCESHSIKSS